MGLELKCGKLFVPERPGLFKFFAEMGFRAKSLQQSFRIFTLLQDSQDENIGNLRTGSQPYVAEADSSKRLISLAAATLYLCNHLIGDHRFGPVQRASLADKGLYIGKEPDGRFPVGLRAEDSISDPIERVATLVKAKGRVDEDAIAVTVRTLE